jgi:hypothetical protein
LERDRAIFKNTIIDLKLVGMMTSDGFHTWNNRSSGKHQTAVILDHFLILESLIQSRYTFKEEILPGVGSNH